MKIHKTAILFYLFLLISAALSAQSDSAQATPTAFLKVDKEAEFPGGLSEWRKYLEKNLNANVPVDNGAPTGTYTVFVQFMVNEEGKVSDIKPLTRFGYGMEQEVTRILQKSGAWEPAMLNGKPVGAYRKQPVTFQISEEGFDVKPSVLYAKQDNEVSIDVQGIKNQNLRVTISQGTIIPTGDGKYIVRVPNAGRAVITVYNAKKGDKEINSASLEVKQKIETK